MKTYDELVKENEGLKERGQKVIESLHETIDKQKAEIERLTEENGWLSKECNRSTTECAELQKQVDYLEGENKKKADIIHTAMNDYCELQKQVDELETVLRQERIEKKSLRDAFERVEKQAIKYTAKEIYRELIEMEENPCNSREEIYQAVFGKRGVEVE